MRKNIDELFELFLKHNELDVKNNVVCTDTRNITPNSIFFALKGDNFNGNKYALKAIESGCSYAIVDEEAYCTHNRTLLVDDVLQTIQQLASMYRTKLNHTIVAITGTNGKTTTKELVNAVLSEKYKVHATKGNLNNHIGVPLTLLSTPADTEIGIVEMGANHPGEIAFLCNIAKPDYGLITNIGKAHLEGFGSFEGVIKTKKEMYDHIFTAQKKIFINNENPLLEKIAANFQADNKILYHTADNIFEELGGDTANVLWKNADKEVRIQSQLFGTYNFENILAAITIGNTFEVDTNSIKKAIETYTPGNNRSQIKQTQHNTLILDAYNANPSSMSAAITNISSVYAAQEVILILGDMLELGNDSIAEHKKILKTITEKNIENVILIGDLFAKAKTNECFTTFETSEKAISWLKNNKIQHKKILIKGSRGIKLEILVEHL